MQRLVLGLILSICSFPLVSRAAEIPPGGTSLFAGDPLKSLTLGGDRTAAKAEIVDVQGQGFSRALRISTTRKAAQRWDFQLKAKTAAPVKRGDVMLAVFWGRVIETRAEMGEGQTELVFELDGAPHTKSIEYPGMFARTWTQVMVPFTAAEDYPAGGAAILFRLGYDAQTIEMGGIQLLHYGKTMALGDMPRTRLSYAGSEPDARWRKAAAERIEQIRKADLAVLVVDSTGKPVPGAAVSVQMRQHAFGFGSAVAARPILDQTPDAQKYRQIIQDHFSRVVFENDLKWPVWSRDRQQVPAALDWLQSHNIAVRGHCLVWPSWRYTPRDLQNIKDDPAALRKRVNDHITDIVTATKGRLVDWDVINEVYTNHDLIDILGKPAMVEWFKLAHAIDPAARLYINDYSILTGGGLDTAHQDGYEQVIRYLKEQGAPIHGAGLQSHFGARLTAPDKLMQLLDRFAAPGLRLQSTEFDINITDEQLQADYLRDFMTTLFSHPAVDGIVMWGFWEGRHWKPNAALWRRDWSLKPSGQMWLDLVKKQWWTTASGQTSAAGQYATRGFLGEYEIQVTANGKTKTQKTRLEKAGQTLKIVVE